MAWIGIIQELNQKLKFLIYDFCETSVSFLITGVLEHGADDFDTVDDLYEAIGDMLLEVDGKGEDDIREICNRLMEVMKRYKSVPEIIFDQLFVL